MFGKKQSKEELDQIEQNFEQGNQLLFEFYGQKEWVESGYDHIGKSRQQMESDIERIVEHISSASEVAKNGSERASTLSHDMDSLCEQMAQSEEAYRRTVGLIGEDAAECQNLVEENKHFTTPSKYLNELPGELRSTNEAYRGMIAAMGEQGRQMGVLALNAAIEAGRMGEQGRQFVTAAEEIRNYAKRYEESAKELMDKVAASEEKVAEMEEVIHHLIALLKEGNIGMAHLMKDVNSLKQHVDKNPPQEYSGELRKLREVVTEWKNGAEEIIKSEERSRIQMDDISEEVESQRKSEQEITGELQKLFYATGLYVDRISQKEESEQ
jgi:methyl-accepting chemotaxis protein